MIKVVEDETPIENQIFLETFFYLKISGFWLPTTIIHPFLKVCYGFLTVFASMVFSSIVLGALIDMVTRREDNYSHILENWCLIAAVGHTLYNNLNLVAKRNQVIELLKTKLLADRWTNLRDAEEVRIIKTSKRNEVNVFRYWGSIITFNAISHALPPIIGENPNNDLLWDSWLPCDKRITCCFLMCYSYQIISYAMTGISHVSVGTIILNIMERICSHIRILQHRLSMLPELVRTGVLSTAEDELFYLNECILDHQNIYSTTENLSRIFCTVIFWHFILMSSILCTTIYLLSSLPVVSFNFLAGCTYLCCMMSQFFCFCWWGYKLTQISSDISYTIFAMNWLELNVETRKRLRFIMLSVSKSIPLFNNFIVELSPEMFLKLMKMSYSAFNLLQTQI